jgi:pimeloyl-ACP methyl ester carboxylesterase
MYSRSMNEISHRMITTNGISMHIAELGEGPLVVLCHGFPELWYSWRHQITALADAGYHVVAPDQRGYGQTDRPASIEAYDIRHLTDDLVGLLDALGEEQAVFVGHDWGAPVVWALARLAPQRVRAVAALSVPFVPYGSHDPVEVMKFIFGENFFYILYFQEPGVADADLDRNPEETLRRTMRTTSTSETSRGLRPLPREGTGWMEWLPPAGPLPPWLTQSDLDYYVAEFTRTGFTGGLNWYRNISRNWEITADIAEKKVEMPAFFLAGAQDIVASFMPDTEMDAWVPDLRAKIKLPGAGHWVQQERADEVNATLLAFLASLS